ncbi:MAG: UDP-N-acetylmuramoyl-tripeptide--D-alanyl-D-alanine ligase, partial [Clostridia bacterium]|nr:UDP-N-acetylmuramoyl-tripeptide--D-alanyl-D-alanine ligase [Clostridia bacterium]
MKNLIKSSKTPLKFTGKLSRLYIISIFVLLGLCFYKYAFCLIFVATFLCPIISNTINMYDKIRNKMFIKKAQKKLKNSYTQVIAITGSNGKTSVKNILLEVLSTEHKVQATPASYNTPIGIAKFINESLEKDTEFLILEYGARH